MTQSKNYEAGIHIGKIYFKMSKFMPKQKALFGHPNASK